MRTNAKNLVATTRQYVEVSQVKVRDGIDLELRALQWHFGTCLPRSGYAPADHPCFKASIGRPFAHSAEHFELHAQQPVRRS